MAIKLYNLADGKITTTHPRLVFSAMVSPERDLELLRIAQANRALHEPGQIRHDFLSLVSLAVEDPIYLNDPRLAERPLWALPWMIL